MSEPALTWLSWPTLFMSTSAAIAYSPLRQAWRRVSRRQAGGLAPRTLNVLFKYASSPHGSAHPSRMATLRFRDESS